MSLFIGIILALFVFFIVVFLHEMGHFLVARWSGVKVHEFGIGIPPRLRRLFTDKHGTEWTLNWLPIGGFVRLKWEDLISPESHSKDSLARAPWWKQVLILLAGVTMNFLLAGCLFWFLFYRGTEPLTIHIRELTPHSLLSRVGTGTKLISINNTLLDAERSGIVTRFPGVLVDPLPGSVAEKSWLKKGDIIIAIDGTPMKRPGDVSAFLKSSELPGHTFRIQRGEEILHIILRPQNGKMGAYVLPNITPIYYQYPFWTSMAYGMTEVYQQIGFSLRTFGAILTTSFSQTATKEEKKEATEGIGWPVAIGRVFVGFADHGVQLRGIITLMAMISLSLWVFNLLPFPALDGGRCLLVVVNQMIHVINPKFKISPRIEQMIHSIGFIILIFASILVTWKDIFIR